MWPEKNAVVLFSDPINMLVDASFDLDPTPLTAFSMATATPLKYTNAFAAVVDPSHVHVTIVHTLWVELVDKGKDTAESFLRLVLP